VSVFTKRHAGPAVRGVAALLLAVTVLLPAGSGCQLPGQRKALVTADSPRDVLERCARAAEAMHFKVKAIDRAHLVVVAEGRVEGRLAFHEVRLSIAVIHEEGKLYRVEAIATSDGRGIRAGAEKKARRIFFEKLAQGGGVH
jgi:hypothetical protein